MVANLVDINHKSELKHYILNLSRDFTRKDRILDVLEAILKHSLDDKEIFDLVEYWFISDPDAQVKYKASIILATLFEKNSKDVFEWGLNNFKKLQDFGAVNNGIMKSNHLRPEFNAALMKRLEKFSKFLRIDPEDLSTLIELDEALDNRLLFGIKLGEDPEIPLERMNFIFSRSHFRKKFMLNIWGQLIFIFNGHVETIKLDGWSLPERLPECVSEFKKLQHLTLRGCNVKKIPSSFGRLKYLKTLSLEKNQLNQIPRSIFRLPNLEKVDLSSNPIKAYPLRYTKLIED